MVEFKVGDIVTPITSYYIVPHGMKGIIRVVQKDYASIEWEGLTGGHNCGCSVPNNSGYNVPLRELQLANQNKLIQIW